MSISILRMINHCCRIVLSVGFCVASLPSSGIAFCTEPNPRVRTELFRSDMVFVGKVVSVKDEKDCDGWIIAKRYLMDVQKVYRGRDVRTVEVLTENASDRLILDPGKSYILFACHELARLIVRDCGNSTEADSAGAVIRQIEEALKDAATQAEGCIRGRVVAHGATNRGVPGIKLEVRGQGKTLVITTDSDGWFEVCVPGGNYSVKPSPEATMKIVPFDLSYDDPNSFVVDEGGGAEVQFVAWETP